MQSMFYASGWALLPPLLAIILTLITKEVYSSLFVGILAGGLMYANFNIGKAFVNIFHDGFILSLTDESNLSVIVFVIILGAMVKLLEWSGGSAAFGKWVSRRIKTKVGAQLATVLLGIVFFIDDGFSCLSVSNIMKPVFDEKKISRAKLAYIVDSTAAPVCILMPISSWGAAVSGYVDKGNGLYWFIRAIPFNFYAIFALIFVVGLVLSGKDYGPMAKTKAAVGDGGGTGEGLSPPRPALGQGQEGDRPHTNGDCPQVSRDCPQLSNLIVPFVVLIIACVMGMLFTGGFFSGTDFYTAVSESNAPLGFVYGSAVALIFTIVYYRIKKVLSYKRLMEALPEGAKMMMPVILILIFAWALKAETSSLGAGYFVSEFVKSLGPAFRHFIPAIVFVFSAFLAFSSGTSWGTFGILIPIVLEMVPLSDKLGIVCLSACLAGSVFGDHCSPLSDTTIMSSAGSACDHIEHVSTQLPYALTVAVLSLIAYIITGFVI